MDDGQGSFVCTCNPEYTGLLCSILTDAPRCMAEVDVTVGSGIQWSDTLAGQYDTQPCPSNTEGSATRNCIEDDLSPTRGLWRRPDLSRCVSPALVTLLSNAGNRAGIQEDLLYNLTRDLDHATSVVKNKSGPSLFPGDLLAASDLLRQISGGVIKAKSIDHDPAGMVKHFLSTVDNILNPAALDVWKNALVHLVEVKVTSIIASSQQFTENLILRHPSMLNISQPGAGTGSPEVASAVFSASSDNVDLRVMEWWDLTSDVSLSLEFARHADLQGAQLTLPPDVITITHGDGSDRPLRLYSARFTSVAPLFSLKENRYKKEDSTNITKIVTSDVISAEVLGVPKSAFSKFTRPVKITFRVTNSSKLPDLKKFCVFMNMTARSADERWLDDGCNVDDANETHVTCFCYHLTNFAVLLDVYDNADKLDEGNSAALSYISYIGGSLSILSCVVVIAVFEYFRLRSDRIRIHEQLAVSIIAVQVFFLIGVGRTAADDDSAMWACKTVAILLHFSLTALFCWMLVEGLHLYVLLVKVFKRGSHIKKYCAIGWGAPTLIVAVSVGVFFDKYGDGEICWLNHEPLLVCFVPTVSLVITINSVILVLVLRVMFKSVNSAAKANTEQQSSVRMSLKASAVLLPLLGLTWILGFLAVDTGHSKVMMYIFNYLFTITNSFQGVMFFVFHCLLNVDVHNAYERRYRQRKKAVSSLETTTRKNSDASTYLADTSPSAKALSKAILSDMSTIHRRPSTAHNRFFLLNRPQAQDDLTRMTFQPVFALAAKSGELAASEANSSNDQQTLENDRVWGGQNDGPSARNGQPLAVLPAATSFIRFPHQPEVVNPGNVVHGIPENNSRVRFS
ncbi:adhesion G protein-coupled receptor L3-like [Pomacea canaliculata]|uniref:adhesion G protein-coupled receptor L3-like n=1 Tax=Pomacea canaliculata TaxID=400727 RepID=UPI000D7339D2|nr:adhesion G protein-coupled receptor L3-like [Pomacea canaliculata]